MLVRRIDPSILAQLKDVPPLEHLGLTANQQQLWHDVRAGTAKLQILLEAYFSGQHTDILDGLRPYERRMYEAIASYYIAFYDLLFWHWKAILDAANHPPDFPKEPGEACLLLIKLETAALIATAHQPYDRYSVKAHRETYSILRKIDANKAIGQEDSALSRRLRKLTQLDDYLEPFFRFKMDVITVCRSGKLTKRQKQALKQFHEAEIEKMAAVEAMLHPRNKSKGWEWHHGEQKAIS